VVPQLGLQLPDDQPLTAEALLDLLGHDREVSQPAGGDSGRGRACMAERAAPAVDRSRGRPPNLAGACREPQIWWGRACARIHAAAAPPSPRSCAPGTWPSSVRDPAGTCPSGAPTGRHARSSRPCTAQAEGRRLRLRCVPTPCSGSAANRQGCGVAASCVRSQAQADGLDMITPAAVPARTATDRAPPRVCGHASHSACPPSAWLVVPTRRLHAAAQRPPWAPCTRALTWRPRRTRT
jgi:hypothetical protein